MATRAAATFRQAFGDPNVAVCWKDPRTTLLLPFWRQVIGRPIACVFCVRHPLEVARSLERRDGLELPVGLALWERYQHRAVAGLTGLPVFVTSYADACRRPEAWREELRCWLESLQVSDLAERAELARRRRSGLLSRICAMSESRASRRRSEQGPPTVPTLRLSCLDHNSRSMRSSLSCVGLTSRSSTSCTRQSHPGPLICSSSGEIPAACGSPSTGSRRRWQTDSGYPRKASPSARRKRRAGHPIHPTRLTTTSATPTGCGSEASPPEPRATRPPRWRPPGQGQP